MSRNYYFVRAMSQSNDDFAVFFDNSVVACGWSWVDFSSYATVDEVVLECDKQYYAGVQQTAPQVLGKRRNQIRRFKNIQKGDRILVPVTGAVCLAEATGVEQHDASIRVTRDLSNQHFVNYVKNEKGNIVKIPRYELSTSLQSRLRLRGTTIAHMDNFADQIDDLFAGKRFGDRIGRFIEEAKESFQRDLLSTIQSGNLLLEGGGIGLEYLVKELLECIGYEAFISSKNRFNVGADADIEAFKGDYFGEQKLLIQVKHHCGHTGTWAAEQLQSIIESDLYRKEFEDHQLVVVTSASADSKLEKYCFEKDIVLMDGVKLVKWISDSLEKLTEKTRHKLGVTSIPSIVSQVKMENA